jgi:hypothetical protein
MAVGWHAVRRSEISKGQVAIVIGCGPIGLAVILMLKAHGVRTVIASDYPRAAHCHPAWRRHRRRPRADSPYAKAKGRGHLETAPEALGLAVSTVETIRKPRLPWWHVWRAADAGPAP